METSSYEQRVHDLDLRQDEILERLAELDQQIQSLIEIWAPKREASPSHDAATVPLSGNGSEEIEEPAKLRRAA